MHALTLRPLAARDRHTASIRPGQGHVVRLIAGMAPLLAAAVTACLNGTGPVACVNHIPNFHLQGTWQGTAPHATLTVTLGQQHIIGFYCGGTIDAGSYADSTINVQGDFAPAPPNSVAGIYTLERFGEGGGATETVLDMMPFDYNQAGVSFAGIVSDTTKNVISGTVIFQNASQTLSDTVAITMVRQ